MKIQKYRADAVALFRRGRRAATARWANFGRRYPRGRKYVRWGVLGGAALTALGGITLLVFVAAVRFGAFGELPSETELGAVRNHNASEVYSADGELLGKYFIENRISARADEIPATLVRALVATEDERFYEHNGWDFRATLRVLFKSILMNDDSSGGGSTISQQLAKNLYPRRDHGLLSMPVNKVREIFIAKRLERVYSKSEIVNLYFNTVSFGYGIFGLKVASRRFFGKDPQDLTTNEAATLVGMLKATTYYNPVRNPERARKRRNVVLAQMVRNDFLPQTAYDTLAVDSVRTSYYTEDHTDGPATYLREHIRLEMEDLLRDQRREDGKPYNFYTDGLRITTTLDAPLQRYAERATAEHMRQLQTDFDQHWLGKNAYGTDADLDRFVRQSERYRVLSARGATSEEIDSSFQRPVRMEVYNAQTQQREVRTMSPLDSIKYNVALLNAGFLAMEPNGRVLAWVGGVNFENSKYDHVTARRQVGSTFKPFVYATALELGHQPCDYLDNLLTTYTQYEDWKPENANGQYGGVYSMAGGLKNSVNAVTVDLIMRTGVEPVRRFAQNLGLDQTPAVPSIALGTVEASLLEMTTAYASLANGGQTAEPYYIQRIETRNGKTLYEHTPEETDEIISPATAQMVTRMLQGVVDGGTAGRMRYTYGVNYQLAGKTGTTQNQTDGWFIGYGPKIVFGAWVGADQPSVRWRSLKQGSGGATALPIVAKFLKRVGEDAQRKQYVDGRFAPLPAALAGVMECADYLDNRLEFLPDESDWVYDDETGTYKRVIKDQRRLLSLNPDRALERIRRKRSKEQRKAERREKRREFFDRVFNND